MLERTYNPQEIENRQYSRWENAGAFECGQPDRKDADPFTIVIPPPNVTGNLHMGHALNNTIQDILVRFERLRGKDVLWQPGTDHAGIATQMVVERQLAANGEPDRHAMGRDAFIEKVWEWKEESGGAIINQLRRLGASCDWRRERFTMDEGLSKAVLKVFVELYNAGLIYKDKRLVNWDPKLLTAISDLEVVQTDQDGHLWHFKYPIKDEEGRFIVVATTRPETMLGDTGIAVHPDDERYKDLVGKSVILPLVGREIFIVADEYADPEQGSGAVKITPAHDFNDFEVGNRHDLEKINIFDKHARLNENVPDKYQGLDRFEARKIIVKEMDELGLLDKIDEHPHTVPYGDRSNVVIEPWLTDQWYVDAKTLAIPAIEAVASGDTKFVPKNWEKTYFEWMKNIQPWCISRQLWWGHQIPAWYGPDGEFFVAMDENEAQQKAEVHYGKTVEIMRDPDVLDTWFSSALWPFSTLGWPEETPELKRHYKTDVLVTGFDIIFFWVARMMMAGLHFQKEVPFHTIYIHALVRDQEGQKMSKTKGNVMDPLLVIDKFGADALRFTLAAMAAQGRDIKLSEDRVEGYRNFATKLWNAARFAEMNGCVGSDGFDPKSATSTVNKWIIGEVEKTASAVTEGIELHRYNDAAAAIYRFSWNVYCDWYLEMIKPVLSDGSPELQEETRETAAWVLDQMLLLLHPFMPFITEELWERTAVAGQERDKLLINASWPDSADLFNQSADDEISWLIEFVSEIRSVRAEMRVPAGAKIPVVFVNAQDAVKERADKHIVLLKRLARLSEINFSQEIPSGSAQIVQGGTTIALPLEGIIDISSEKSRLEKEINKLKSEISSLEGRLSDEKFMSKAPDHVVETQRNRKIEAEDKCSKLELALKRIS